MEQRDGPRARFAFNFGLRLVKQTLAAREWERGLLAWRTSFCTVLSSLLVLTGGQDVRQRTGLELGQRMERRACVQALGSA